LPRMLGYAFNPISVWFGFGPGGDLRGAIYEVRNTFGEHHCYVSAAPLAPHATAKAFHVSPFFAVNGDYRFGLTAPEEHFGLRVENWVDGALTHRATLSGTRKPLTDLRLLQVLARFPLMTLGVTAAIHWQALWIWLKGARYHPKPAAPATAMSATAPVPITHPKHPADQG